jgi:CRISPR system Cascade subunit CasE
VTSDLYMVRLVLNRRAVLRVGVRHRLGQAADDGALLHAGLSRLFAQNSDRVKVPFHSFAVDDTRAASLRQPDLLFVLAYASVDEAQLTLAMGPARTDLVRRCETRKIPDFAAGQHLAFRTRVCPVTRTRSAGHQGARLDQRGRAKHREIDAFVHASLALPPETRLEREEVYTRWLQQQTQKNGACTLRNVRLAEFGLDTMRRRGNARLVRPNVVLEGTLSITDPGAFRQLLARGVGRHRAFGFGMLLLRPVGGLTC